MVRVLHLHRLLIHLQHCLSKLIDNQAFPADSFLALLVVLFTSGFSGTGENPLSKETSAKIKAILSSALLVLPWQLPQQKVTSELATFTVFWGSGLYRKQGNSSACIDPFPPIGNLLSR